MILVVDDVDFVRNPMIEIVKRFGDGEVKGLTNGRELVEFYSFLIKQNNLVNLIILDLLMPVMSGMEALKEIRKMDSKVPIALFSGLLSEEVFEEAYTLGVRHVINKPINEKQAKKVIKKYIN